MIPINLNSTGTENTALNKLELSFKTINVLILCSLITIFTILGKYFLTSSV